MDLARDAARNGGLISEGVAPAPPGRLEESDSSGSVELLATRSENFDPAPHLARSARHPLPEERAGVRGLDHSPLPWGVCVITSDLLM